MFLYPQDMLITLAETKPELDIAVVVVFIASEESTAIQDVGVDMLVKDGKLGASHMRREARKVTAANRSLTHRAPSRR